MAKLNDLQVSFISLVEKPANMKEIIAKISGNAFNPNIKHTISVVKTDKLGLVYGVVYEANKKDSHGDWADMETIKKAAHEFMEKGLQANVDTNHNTNKSGSVIVESYLTDNALHVVIKCDPAGEVFQKILKGNYQGLSLMGVCRKTEEEPPKEGDSKEDSSETKRQLIEVCNAMKVMQDQISNIVGTLKSTNLSRQMQFNADGTITVKNEDDTAALIEFKFEEVN